jgi:hypothetical protein
LPALQPTRTPLNSGQPPLQNTPKSPNFGHFQTLPVIWIDDGVKDTALVGHALGLQTQADGLGFRMDTDWQNKQ